MADRSPLLLAFAAGILVGAVAIAAFQPPVQSGPVQPGPDSESPPFTIAMGGPNCLDSRHGSGGGWVHEVAAGTSYAVTLNATVVHDRGEAVAANVSRTAPGGYAIDLRTVPATDDAKSPSGDCRVATRVELGASLPTDYREFRVTANGRTLLTVERDDTTADLYRLPHPVNASAS